MDGQIFATINGLAGQFDPIDDTSCVFRTETRVVTTDANARSRFRWYWARFSPGIALIRRAMVQRVKTHAENSVPVTVR